MVFGLFKKKSKETEIADSRFLNLKIKEVKQVAKETVNLVFEKPESGFNYHPGQFITIISEVGGKKVRRAYSLCTTPFIDEHPAVTVRRVPGGLMSNHINDHFKAGDVVEIMEPMGRFTTEYNASASRQAIFFGGGSGITPLYSVLRSVLKQEPNSKVALVYANRSVDYIVFKSELENLKSEYGDRFECIHVLEENGANYGQYTGRLNQEVVAEIIARLGVTAQTEYYICGPEPMMHIAKSGLISGGAAESQVRMESFEAGKTSPSDVNTTSSSGAFSGTSRVTVLMYGDEYQVTVDAKKAILDAGLDANIDMPYSCQSGLCTACRAKCIEGEVSLDDAEGLSDKEKAEGYVLLCVGKPKSDKITVEVG